MSQIKFELCTNDQTPNKLRNLIKLRNLEIEGNEKVVCDLDSGLLLDAMGIL